MREYVFETPSFNAQHISCTCDVKLWFVREHVFAERVIISYFRRGWKKKKKFLFTITLGILNAASKLQFVEMRFGMFFWYSILVWSAFFTVESWEI